MADNKTELTEKNWMDSVIQEVWGLNMYWALSRQYLKDQPIQSFFYYTWFALKHELVMKMTRTVEICKQVPVEAMSDRAKKALDELMELYERGESKDRRKLDFDDCGVKVFRDKTLAHPLVSIKELHGKDSYKLSMKWETVEATLNKIKEFCNAIEFHNNFAQTYLEDMGDGERVYGEIKTAFEDAEKFHKLKAAIFERGSSLKLTFDFNTDEFVLLGK